MEHAHIVKRKGHKESYDNHKVYASCYASCLNAHSTKEDAEKLCEKVMLELDRWIGDKREIDSGAIFKEIINVMKKLNEKAAFMYETHRDIA